MLWLISADPIIVEVAPNEENVQLPTETTEEWQAAPGGVFAPVGPNTSPGGKARKVAPRRAHPYRRPSPKEPSTVAGAPACAGIGAVVESMGDRLEKVTLGVGDDQHHRRNQTSKWLGVRGITAEKRKTSLT